MLATRALKFFRSRHGQAAAVAASAERAVGFAAATSAAAATTRGTPIRNSD